MKTLSQEAAMRVAIILAFFAQAIGPAVAQTGSEAPKPNSEHETKAIEMLKKQFPPDAKIETWTPSSKQKDFHEKLQLKAVGEHRTTVSPGYYHHGGPIYCIEDGSGANHVARCVWMRVCGIPVGATIDSVKGMASNTYDEYYYPCKELGECSTGWAKFFDRPTRTHDAGGQCVFWRFGNWKHDRSRDVKLEVYWTPQ
jgi:hypothetical protein